MRERNEFVNLYIGGGTRHLGRCLILNFYRFRFKFKLITFAILKRVFVSLNCYVLVVIILLFVSFLL